MARLRGPQLTPGDRVTIVLAARDRALEAARDEGRTLGRVDALTEALQVAERLGLDILAPMDPGDLVRFVYAQGWQGCEKRLGATDIADEIDQALREPGRVLERRSGESEHGWQVRAVQQVVAYGMAKR